MMVTRAVSFVLVAFLCGVGIARADLYVNFKDGLVMGPNHNSFGCHVEGSTLRCTNNFELPAKEGRVLQAQGSRGYIWAAFVPYGRFERPYVDQPVYPNCQVSIWRQYLPNTAEHRWHVEIRSDEPDRVKCWYNWTSNSNSANTVNIHAQKIK